MIQLRLYPPKHEYSTPSTTHLARLKDVTADLIVGLLGSFSPLHHRASPGHYHQHVPCDGVVVGLDGVVVGLDGVVVGLDGVVVGLDGVVVGLDGVVVG